MLLILLKKEVKELLMEKSILIGILIVPLIIFPIMGGLTSIGMSTAVQGIRGELIVGIADLDRTNVTMSLLPQVMESEGIRLVELDCPNLKECIHVAEENNLKIIIFVPKDFSKNFTSGVKSVIETVYTVESFTISDLTIGGKISSTLAEVFRKLAENIHGGEVNLEFFETPVSQKSLVVYLGRIVKAPIEVVGSTFMAVLVGIPMVAVIISSYASSIAATSIALEKESKTLELLLMIPARRITIMLSKLLGTFLIVLLGTLSFIVGFVIYGLMVTAAMIPTQLDSKIPVTGLDFSPFLYPPPVFFPILISAVFLTMIMTTCIGLFIGILGSDARSAQQLVGAVTFPLLMPPFFILMFTSFNNLPIAVKTALYFDPFTHLFLAIQSGFMGNVFSAALSLAIMFGYTVFMLLLSSWLFMGERLITMKITLRKKPAEGEE